MGFPHRFGPRPLPSVSFSLLAVMLTILWLAGGASRADMLGQVMVRAVAALALIAAALFADKPQGRMPWIISGFLAAAFLLPLLQLVPLPPALWQSLPSRDLIVQAVAGEQPWRPLSLQPGATLNAAASLLVPAAVLVLMAGTRQEDQHSILAILLWLIMGSALIGLAQFSGIPLYNPLVNSTPETVTGLFANRNHFATLLALGCLVAPVWASRDTHRSSWRIPVALGLVTLLVLVILASGSRAGILLGTLGLAIGLFLARHAIRRLPRWMTRRAQIAAALVIVSGIAVLVLLSFTFDRAQSINRVVSLDSVEDMRVRALPTIMTITRSFFPFGAGFGSFDPVFRMFEPFGLLKPTYFNHAHNDFLEVALDGGLPGLLLLTAALVWWLLATVRVWRLPLSPPVMQGRLGSAMLLLIIIASAVDYPARTPLFMAFVIVGAVWLSWGLKTPVRAALPTDDRHL